ncbi:urease accessory protein UreD [Fictibacillus sp. S7]|uniref:urease accessory protein UreD n=1 Tax=Fictibacillus sp. S7 TaxID=2212476 RepID=UPI001012FDE1|nr:urease accessory protein UreD [Fictibacillus sp. S7]RXZ00823.1 urease accessory protein ureD [Fictibacillus sp. S7]
MRYTGVLELSAAKKQPKTIVSSCYYEGALKITRPVYLEENLPSIYLIHVGGGYVNGDKYLLNLNLDEGAELAVTTQSSTKVYKTPKAHVVQQTNIKLNKGSILEYLPDPLIAYKGARFIQETTVHIEDESCFLYSDIITPGWAEDGSFFRYDWIRSKLKVYKNERLIIFDHLLLEPDGEMNGMMQMDGCTHVGMFLILHNEARKDFLDRLYEMLEDTYPGVRFGLSALPESGGILRILARNTGVIKKMIAYAHTVARSELLGKDSVTWRKY